MRRRERARRRRFLAGAIVTILLIAVSVLRLSRVPAVVTTDAAAPAAETLLAAVTEPAVADAAVDRPIYPYSIIEGGAPTPEVLRKAIEADPVVRTHYAIFNLEKTHVVRLTQPRVVHVSYRIGNDIFWTRRPLLLKEGETLLTDGEHYARTRCGNRLAISAAVVSAAEPAPAVLDTPLPRRQGGRLFPSVTLPGSAAGSSAPVTADRGGSFPGGGIASTPGGLIGSTVAVVEPGPISLEGDSSPFPPAGHMDTPPNPLPPNG